MRNFLFLSLIFLSTCTSAQSGGTLYSGIFYSFSPDKNMTPSASAHMGYNFGLNARLNDDPMYFLFTAEYGAFNLVSTAKINFVSEKNLTYTKGKFGLGWDLGKVGKNTMLRTKFQGNILAIYNVDREVVPTDAPPSAKEYILLNEAIGGLSTGLGLTYKKIDLDLEYEHGIYNIYYGKKETTLNTITFTAGFRF